MEYDSLNEGTCKMSPEQWSVFVEGVGWLLGIIAILWVLNVIFSDADKNFDDEEDY